MVTIGRGEVWWVDLGAPGAAVPGVRRPVLVVQGDALNRSRISTVVCVPLTSNLHWATAPGNVSLSPDDTGLPKESVANVSQIVTLDKTTLSEQAGKIPQAKLDLIITGIDTVLGR